VLGHANIQHYTGNMMLILVLLMYLGTEIWTMITVKDNISQLTHIVGGVCGAAFGVILMNEKKTEE